MQWNCTISLLAYTQTLVIQGHNKDMACKFSAAIIVACLVILFVSAAATEEATMGTRRWMDMGPAPVPRPYVSGSILTSVPSVEAVILAWIASAFVVLN